MKKYLFTILTTAVLSITGCTEVVVCIHENGVVPGESTSPDRVQSLITFNAAIESRNVLTRSMTPIPKDVKVNMFAYYTNAPTSSTASGEYQATTAGMLGGVDGYRMFLEDGSYNFYAFSNNTLNTPVPFTDGVSAPLSNNNDYLWWKGTQVTINGSQVSVPILLMHCATQVVFEIEEGPGIKINEIVGVDIIPAAEGARINLLTGVIPPTTSYGTDFKPMGLNGAIAQYIMLPIKTNVKMQGHFKARVNDEPATRTYIVDIPIPNGELVAGDSYRFRVIIAENDVIFGNVNIKDWVDIDETGKPIYPV